MKDKVMDALQRFSKAMFIPVLILPIAGILIAVGNLFTNVRLQAVLPFLNNPVTIGFGTLLSGSLNAILGNLGVIFCVGLSVGLANKKKSEAGFISLLAFLVFLNAMNKFMNMRGMLVEGSLSGTGQAMVLGVQVLDMGVFIGLLLGIVVAYIHNRFCETEFNNAFQIYGGTRFVFIVLIPVMVVLAVLFTFVWPYAQAGINALGGFIRSAGNFGLFIYGTLERLLIPTGLHHLIYTPFQFSALGNSLTVGDATYTGSYIVMMMEYSMGLPFSDGIVWMYTGFTKTFGYFGIVAAFIFCARKENRKKTAAVLVPLAFTASLASITEPLDFMFCFSAPILWVAHACISGLFIVLLHIFHVTGFTTNLLGSVLMNLSAGADKTNYPILYLLALCQIAVYFVVFTLLIKTFNIHTPGREEVSTETAKSAAPAKKASVKNAAEVQCVIDGLGGKENILSVDNCFTRLRVNIKDPAKLDEAAINKLPNSGIVKKGTDIQIVYGLQVADIKRAVEAQLENQ